MSFTLQIPRFAGQEPLDVIVDLGQSVFVLGANGTGKSGLMHKFYSDHRQQARRVTAHRQTWLASNAVSLSGQDKRTYATNLLNYDAQDLARWKDDFALQRSSIALYELIDAENVRARAIAGALTDGDVDGAKRLANKQGPVAIINDLLQLSSIPVVISIVEDEQVLARKSDSVPYSVAELSDGERNALLLGSSVLTAKPGTLVLIDEPERHLHRSIISPLLKHLFAQRPDCAFVISTHDVDLSIEYPEARTLLVRGCVRSGFSFTWDVDLVQPGAQVDEDLRRDIFGARRRLLFVEGTGSSLDAPLYRAVFPGISIIAKGSSRDVEHAVAGVRGAQDLHWVRAFGVIDSDSRPPDEVIRLKEKGVYALPVFSVESLYYNPTIQQLVAERHAAVVGGDAPTRVTKAKAAALAAITSSAAYLSGRVAEKTVRERIMRRLPSREDIIAKAPLNISIDVAAAVEEENRRLDALLAAGDLDAIIARYPVRDTQALPNIAKQLGFQGREQYESAVRTLLAAEEKARAVLKALFGTLPDDIAAG